MSCVNESKFQELKARGFFESFTSEIEIKKLLENDKRTNLYVGFDPTADSLHVGSLIQLLLISHLKQSGHNPIAVIGGGTAMIGDPSGKTEMRKMLSATDIDSNAEKLKVQLLSFGASKVLNNKEWLLELNYIEFLRNVGKYFSVNKMLSAEAYKQRLKSGLSFLEFNYQLLQAYDYLTLYKKFNVEVQFGGNDQYGNILAGIDLIRREGGEAHAFTTPLLTTSSGEKFGKTAKGAIWLDKNKTSVNEFFQFWYQTSDYQLDKYLKLFTFLSLEKIKELVSITGEARQKVKQLLAKEVTAIVHGPDAADSAEKVFLSMQSNCPDGMTEFEVSTPTTIINILFYSGLALSKSEARRMILANSVSVDALKIKDFDFELDPRQGPLILKVGKSKALLIKYKHPPIVEISSGKIYDR
jgi:tyrosyl-tRNA synthetase